MINGELTVWSIHFRPSDRRGPYFAVVDAIRDRPDSGDAIPVRDSRAWPAPTLEEARAIVRQLDPSANARLDPSPDDDPEICEVWL